MLVEFYHEDLGYHKDHILTRELQDEVIEKVEKYFDKFGIEAKVKHNVADMDLTCYVKYGCNTYSIPLRDVYIQYYRSYDWDYIRSSTLDEILTTMARFLRKITGKIDYEHYR